MSRRQPSAARRFVNTGPFPFAPLHPKASSSPMLSVALILLGTILFICYAYSESGFLGGDKRAINHVSSEDMCAFDVHRAIPTLKETYGDSMRKVLHVGPDTCSVVSELLKEKETEAWGIEPYDIEDVDGSCKRLVRNGIVRVADIKFPLPYRAKSFSLVIISDALDYLSPKYLNKTLPELAKVSSDGVVIFAGTPGIQRAKSGELSKFGRPAKMRSSSWWTSYFAQNNLEENEVGVKKFGQAAMKNMYIPSCQVLHLNSYS